MVWLFRLFLLEKREEFFEFGEAWLPAVFADLESLGVLDAAASFLTVKLNELFAESVGGGESAAAKCLTEFAFFGLALGRFGGHGNDSLEISGGPKALNL